MKTLWLHGMGARPKEWQLTCMISNGLEPYALHLQYDNSKTFEVLSEYIQKNQIRFLVGRSHGGFLAYWLSEAFAIPCLAINPHFSSRAKRFVTPNISQRSSPLSMIVLGSDDELVDADRSLLFIESERKQYPDKLILTRVLDGVGHWLDPDSFQVQIKWALAEYHKIKS